MAAVGICMGASNIKITQINEEKNKVVIKNTCNQTHEGNVKDTLKNIADNYNFNDELMAVTGRKFKSLVNLPSLSEAEATELAYEFLENKYSEVDAIVSAGGETFMVYEVNKKGKIINVYTGNKCASGTGEFFLQQIKRMDLNVNKAMEQAEIENPYRVSGRCSVFCKSDCTHALNKGEDKGRIVAGLCEMMVDKIMELLNKCEARKIMVVGGTSQNQVMIDFLKQRLEKVIVPEEACYFEALGASIWALDYGKKVKNKELFNKEKRTFDFLPPLKDYKDKVNFYNMEQGEARDGDRCILGLDVGSTTTKAVIIREKDDALLASEYLRTSGDPVAAARNCYKSLYKKLKNTNIEIIGLGVTGSGRKITGLHALTDSVVNEIIAHATGAVFFDEEVDTIFEIGGQDAKYTYIVNQVPTDYAMNEACSAGTGSFLEESAEESLNIQMEDIADIALKGENPPNFSDQCAAFISSDIKNAIQEGISIENICAGLVYSICLNYTNRVKGNRPVGDKVFMQGGVCYNKAVPMAMAALTGKEIIVPPEPGLMGAFGVALVVKQQLDLGLIEENKFDLKQLMERKVEYGEPFVCSGGKENCDRKCKINILKIDGNKYPFGGICNKYMNMNQDEKYDIRELDLVRYRENLIYNKYFGQTRKKNKRGKIGINRSLAVNTLLPFFSNFFSELGYEVILPENIREEGIQKQTAAFCYPVEISHGYMYDLLEKDLDYIFLPHIKGLYVNTSNETSVLCPMAQAEPYYLSATWEQLESDSVFSPVLDFKNGYNEVKEEFIEIGNKLGISKRETIFAFGQAVNKQKQFKNELKNKGKETLKELKKYPEKKAIVIFGRPYNALVSDANMGIPHKFASRGEQVIPFDMLPIEDEEVSEKMYWSMGQLIMKGTRYINDHSQLFGAYITNFSCGPDSFLVSYFRNEQGRKPSLTLELDSHTADAGLNTRIEAFLDVIDSYRKLQKQGIEPKSKSDFTPAEIRGKGNDMKVIDSRGYSYSLTDDRVQILVPSMGGLSTRSFVSALKYSGVNAAACPPPEEPELKLGRANSTGKECLPLQLTLGSLLRY
ncbi:MAG: acyl-CoA dehydratase activase, partial [Bacillota bacterium]